MTLVGPSPTSMEEDRGSSDCRFCGVRTLPNGDVELVGQREYRDLVGPLAPPQGVATSRRAVVVADVSPLSSCHALVLPSRHVNASVLLSGADLHAQRSAVESVVRSVLDDHPHVAVFEHGTARGAQPGIVKCASTEHAHIHVVGLHEIGGDPARLLLEHALRQGDSVRELRSVSARALNESLVHFGSYHVVMFGSRNVSRAFLYQVRPGGDQRQVFRRFFVESGLSPEPDRIGWDLGALYPTASLRRDLVATAQFIQSVPVELRVPAVAGS